MKTGKQHRTAKKTVSRRSPVSQKSRLARRRTYPLHKRFLLHPAGLFAVLCSGVFIVGWTYRVVAATIVSSVIEAPALTTPAVITSPVDGSSSDSITINVTGTCPTDSYIKLSDNSAFRGVAWCLGDNTFAIQVSLFSGINALIAQDYNQTDLVGPASPAVSVTYTPPATAGGTTDSGAPATPSATTGSPAQSSTAGNSVTGPPLLLSSDFRFQTFSAQKTFVWTGNLEGGKAPYYLQIDWGDGQTSHMFFPTDPPFTLKHVYKNPGYYAVVLKSTDSNGQVQVMQLAALITDASGQAGFLNNTGGPAITTARTVNGSLVAAKKWLLFAWPTYLIIVLMTTSFWLGERKEFALLRVHNRSHRSR